MSLFWHGSSAHTIQKCLSACLAPAPGLCHHAQVPTATLLKEKGHLGSQKQSTTTGRQEQSIGTLKVGTPPPHTGHLWAGGYSGDHKEGLGDLWGEWRLIGMLGTHRTEAFYGGDYGADRDKGLSTCQEFPQKSPRPLCLRHRFGVSLGVLCPC